MIERIKNFFKQTNIFVILIGVIIALLVITIVFISPGDNSNGDTPGGVNQPDGGSQDEVQDIDENVVAEPSNYNDSTERLLNNLPYYSDSFDANYLPLDPDTKPIILVTVFSDNGGQEFLNWARQFGNIDVEVQYVEDLEFHGPYE
jgi:hypothetical protein